MLTEQQIAALPLPLVRHFISLETSIIEKICERLGKVGSLTATDIQKLNELQNIGYDLSAIQKDVADVLGKSYGEIYDIFFAASEIEYENGAKAYFDLTGNKFTPFSQNAQLQNLVESISRSTYGLFKNISATKAIGLTDRFGQFNLLGESYKNAVDYAILQVRTGQSDFYSSMRQTVKSFADNGLTHVEYDTGYRKRLDSSVRQAVLGGQKELSKRQAEMIGEQIGADGWEITWHSGYRTSPPAPRAHDFGGKQFTFGEFTKQDIGGMMDEYNCYHRKFPVIVGVSRPAYTPEQLAELNAAEKEAHNWNGKEYNRYEATQRQRQYETAIRQKKDEAMAHEALAKGHLDGGGSKNDDLYKQYKEQATLAKAKAQALNQEYARFSNAMGISTEPKRATVGGYTRGANINVAQKATNSQLNNVIINILPQDLIEQTLNTTKSISSDMAYSLMKTNPNYAPNTQYKVNCQRCVPTYEIRRRGYNVEALPKPIAGNANNVNWGYELFYEAGTTTPIADYTARHKTISAFKNDLMTYPDDSRFGVYIAWNKKSAHTFVCEKINGKLYFIDPQNNNIDCENYLGRRSNINGYNFIKYFRMDDKDVNISLLQEAMKGAK